MLSLGYILGVQRDHNSEDDDLPWYIHESNNSSQKQEGKEVRWLPKNSQQGCTEGMNLRTLPCVASPLPDQILVIARPTSLPPTYLDLLLFHSFYYGRQHTPGCRIPNPGCRFLVVPKMQSASFLKVNFSIQKHPKKNPTFTCRKTQRLMKT